MKYSLTFAAVALIAAATAQDTHGIPTCAVQCILDATSSATSCGQKEFSCQCIAANQAKITSAALGCVTSKCEPADQLKTLSATKALCANPPADEGTVAPSSAAPVAPASSAAPATPSSTKAAAVPATPSSTKAAAVPATPSSTKAAAVPATTVGVPETVYVTVCSSTQVHGGAAPTGGKHGNGTTPTGPATPSFSTGAGAKLSAGLGSVAAFALAALAL
ncbi:hypothetical protein VC83_00565 [Pseudogymnoascus destructans]|uniref:CFEM domain-containing protein n=1 Tax=Pseudogymnoascus destructans TaxID=655981 RepID=A0A177AMC5_9PEZI|nr:uncharacterized protein VC83_00565 [Pseudogymnoascus destructans]OAF63188.2 hypothetical protein VC83_00565 [Pseudogymnoascus destructans]